MAAVLGAISCGCTHVVAIKSAVAPLVLKERVTVSARTILGNTVTWTLEPGVYKPVYEDADGVFYIAERPVIRVSPISSSIGTDSGVYVYNLHTTKIDWAVWDSTAGVHGPRIDATFPFIALEK